MLHARICGSHIAVFCLLHLKTKFNCTLQGKCLSIKVMLNVPG